jgi:hypothetical protein
LPRCKAAWGSHLESHVLLPARIPRYNRFALLGNPLQRLLGSALLLSAALWASACAVPLGPGYEVQKQELRVRFEASSDPVTHVEAEYEVKNTGNQPLPALEVRMPGRRFQASNLSASWDGGGLPLEESQANTRDTVLRFATPWALSTQHTLRIAFDIRGRAAGEGGLHSAPDAFFLPEQGWNPELLPQRGLFGTGGVPPKKWNLVVTVPQDFRVHASGKPPKRSRRGGEASYRCEQRPQDRYPFVAAGRYGETMLSSGDQKVYLWTRAEPERRTISEIGTSLTKALDAYDAVFGVRSKKQPPLWIVECPSPDGCFTGRNAPYAKLLGGPPSTTTAELISLDTLLVNFKEIAPTMVAAAAPSLAASWLGYGRNPGFFEQHPPLSAFPIFAAAIGREAVEGSGAREEMIRSALQEIPAETRGGATETAEAVRAKSFLFFYALRDRYGVAVFRKAIRHMLTARQGRGFDLDDLIAAFEQETHQNVAEFVRQWMKRPGVPQEFRERYGAKTAPSATTSKENAP